MSDIDRSLYNEVLAEIGRVQRPIAFKLESVIDIEGFIIKPFRVVNLDVARFFQTNTSDEIVIEVAVTEGDFTRHIYPKRQKLQVELTRIYVGEVEDLELKGIQPVVRRFSAILQDSRNIDLQGGPSTSADNTLLTIQLQLFELTPEQLRMQTVGGCFHREKPSDVIKTLLGKYSKKLQLPKEVVAKGVYIYQPNNDLVRTHTLIPDDTELLELPGYIQKHCGGLYNSGAGLYYHENVWFVYPLLDDRRYEKESYVLDVFIVPPNRLAESDRTYRAIDGRLQIVSTGGSKQSDTSDIDHLRFGNGVIFASAKDFFNGYAPTKGNVATTQPLVTTSRFVIEKRDNPLQFTPFSSKKFTDNQAYEFSKLRARSTQVIAFAWDNARPELLYPGMPVKLYYGTEGGNETLYGTLASVQEHTKPNQSGMGVQRYKSTCVISAVFPSE